MERPRRRRLRRRWTSRSGGHELGTQHPVAGIARPAIRVGDRQLRHERGRVAVRPKRLGDRTRDASRLVLSPRRALSLAEGEYRVVLRLLEAHRRRRVGHERQGCGSSGRDDLRAHAVPESRRTIRIACASPTSQIAPAFGAVVADFDGDGREDLFLAQNFSPTDNTTMRFDAGAGQLLLGDGRGGFRALGVREAGIAVLGDGRRGCRCRLRRVTVVSIIAVAQNGAETTLWHNGRAAPGLRVKVSAGAGNPLGIGAQLRIVAGTARGPVREVRAGSGYWSMDGAVTVLAMPPGASALWVRWPGGGEQIVPLKPGQRDVTISPRAPSR